MFKMTENWSTPPAELAASDKSHWDGTPLYNIEPAEEETIEAIKIPYGDVRLKRERDPGVVYIDPATPERGFLDSKLDAYARFRDDLDGKRMAFRAWRRMVVDHGLSYPYAKELFAREIVPTKVSDKYKNFKELDKNQQRRYILTRALGTIALAAATYVAYRYYAPEPK
jgi:hypothetical protein